MKQARECSLELPTMPSFPGAEIQALSDDLTDTMVAHRDVRYDQNYPLFVDC